MSRMGISNDPDGTHYLLQSRNIDNASLSFDVHSLKRFKPNLSKSDKVLENDDVIFLAKGSTNYAVHIKKPEEELLASGSFFVLTPDKEEILPAYLAWYLNQEVARRYFFRMGTHGAHMPVISRKTLENLEVRLPEMRIQQLIADLSELSEHEQQLLNEIKKLRKELIKELTMQLVEKDEGQNNE